MKAKRLLYAGIILFPFFSINKSKAQNRERHRSVTINQTVVDGKVIASDTIITYTDTTTRTINSKEVSMDLPYTKGGTVYIENDRRKLNIRQSKDGKVRLVTTTFFYGNPDFTNEQWLEKLNIQMKKTDTGIVITSGSINRSTTTTSSWSESTTDWSKIIAERNEAVLEREKALSERSREVVERSKALSERNKVIAERNNGIPEPPAAIAPPTTTTNGAVREVRINGQNNTFQSGPATTSSWSSSVGYSTAVFDEKGNNVYNSSSLRRELTIYIPADVKLNVVSKYADVTADHDLKNLRIKISNGSLDMVNADNVVIVSGYSNVSCGNLTNADITATNGKLSLKNVDQLTLNTKYSKVALDNCNALTIKSTSDDYDLDVVQSLIGTKTYGNLRLDKLTGSFDLKGSSADVRIRNIEPSVSTITLDNKYADVQLPVNGLKNYEVLFSGTYSSVFAPFERRDTTIEKKLDESVGSSNLRLFSSGTLTGSSARKNNNGFSAIVGDTKGTHTKFNLTCSSCNVDFK